MLRRIHLQAISPGEIRLDDVQAHHARDVLRLETGAVVELFDDAGNVARGEIISLDPHVVVRAGEISSAASGVCIIVASAVPKGDRADWMIEKLSELGVDSFIPLKTERSIVHPRGSGKRERWERIAVESAKQSRRKGVMKIEELTEVSSAAALRSAAAWGCFLSTSTDAKPLVEAVSNLKSDTLLYLFIGPEGGWTDGEIALLSANNLTSAKLTATILRVETAAIAAAAIVQSFFAGKKSVSQYPPPYSQPPYPQQPYPGQFDYYQPLGGDALGPARRAGILMFVLGGLFAVLGSCNTISALVVNPVEVYEKQSQLLHESQAFQMSPQMFRTMAVTFGIGMLLIGVLLIALGAVVRRGGSTGAIVTSLIIVSLIVLGLLLLSLGSVVVAITGGVMGFITLCVFGVPFALFALLDVWLVQAAFATSRVRAMQQQYQTQMWQYQQQAAAGGWSYGAQAPPPEKSPPPPPEA